MDSKGLLSIALVTLIYAGILFKSLHDSEEEFVLRNK